MKTCTISFVSKEISATELTQATLEDIKSRETAINAFVTIAEEQALAQAKAIDEAGIDTNNVLSGIPLAVKDNISTDGILTTAASKMLYNYEPIFDATAVSNAKIKRHDCCWEDQHGRICHGWFR